MKRLLIGFTIGALWMSGAMAGTKSYTVKIPEKFSLRGVQLKPGEYRMKIAGSVAVLSDDQMKEVVTAPVTVSTMTKKFGQTEILASQASDHSNRIDAIELQGTKLKVEFRQ